MGEASSAKVRELYMALTADGNACAARKRSYRLTRFRERNRYLERSCERTRGLMEGADCYGQK